MSRATSSSDDLFNSCLSKGVSRPECWPPVLAQASPPGSPHPQSPTSMPHGASKRQKIVSNAPGAPRGAPVRPRNAAPRAASLRPTFRVTIESVPVVPVRRTDPSTALPQVVHRVWIFRGCSTGSRSARGFESVAHLNFHLCPANGNPARDFSGRPDARASAWHSRCGRRRSARYEPRSQTPRDLSAGSAGATSNPGVPQGVTPWRTAPSRGRFREHARRSEGHRSYHSCAPKFKLYIPSIVVPPTKQLPRRAEKNSGASSKARPSIGRA